MNKSKLGQRFLRLVDSYKQVIYKVCFMYATEDETISDLYQEVVLNLWTAFPRFRSESKPSTWVYRISVNTCISRLRHNIRQPKTVSITTSMADLFPEESEREQLKELYQLKCLIIKIRNYYGTTRFETKVEYARRATLKE